MQPQNPYASPNTNVEIQTDGNFGSLKLFSTEGRFGRIRYLMYTMGISLLGMVVASILLMIPVIGVFLALALYVGIFVVTVFLTIQRCHDFNTTGWLSLLIIVPLVPLIFYLIPGSKGGNNYGLQPPPNSTAIKVGAFLLLGVFLIAIAAAIAIPAYQGYVSLSQ